MALLRRRGVDVALVWVGSSESSGLGAGKGIACPAIEGYRKLAGKLGVARHLFTPGRVSPELTKAYYHLLDVVVITRRPLPVCELVSPMKPLEAAAHGKQVLMSDVGPLADLAGLSSNFHYFAKGDVHSLTDKLGELLAAGNFSPPRSPGLEAYSWENNVQPIVRVVQELSN